jgi:hypothetical protein
MDNSGIEERRGAWPLFGVTEHTQYYGASRSYAKDSRFLSSVLKATHC